MEVEEESSRQLIRLNTALVRQVRIDEVLRAVIEQSVSVLDGFVIRIGGDLDNSF